MTTATWPDVIAWDTVNVPMFETERWATQFQHCHTAMLETEPGALQREGLTVWESRWRGARVGLSWRWALRGQRVIAIADPMRVASNARWLLADGQPVSVAQSVVLLNEVIHGLPWQATVLAQSRQPRRRMDVLASISAAERRGL